MVYLDYGASTPIHPRVLDAMVDVYRNHYGNPSSRTHLFGQEAMAIVDRARAQIASVLEIDKNEVLFTSGATESDNIAILGLAKWGVRVGRRHIVSTRIEHKAVLEPLRYLSSQGFEVDLVPVDESGRVSAQDILKQLRDDTLLVSVMHANNETGVIQPIVDIGDVVAETPTYFHVDAAQTFGKLIDELRRTRYDLLSISGHKIYGPQGIGCLVVRKRGYRKPPLEPIQYGGGHEGGIRPGTLPVALIAGIGVAAESALEEQVQREEEAERIKQSVIQQLGCVHYMINGDQSNCLSNVTNVSFPGVNSEALMLAIKSSLAVSNGSACTSSSHTPSHVLTAMGFEPDRIESSIRISWGFPLRHVDVSPLARAVQRIQ